MVYNPLNATYAVPWAGVKCPRKRERMKREFYGRLGLKSFELDLFETYEYITKKTLLDMYQTKSTADFSYFTTKPASYGGK